jgi:hypothetical protein
MKPEDIRDRCLLALYPSGGVAINLDTGNYFRLDAMASQICEILTDASVSDPALEIARRLNIPRVRAGIEVADTCAALAAVPTRGTPPGPYHFHPEAGGYGLWHAGTRVLTVSEGDLEIAIAPDAGVASSPLLELYVRALAPKIMFLRGLTVIHASACAHDDVLVAFAGLSGAGKTTTARAFETAGAQLVVEDLAVLQTSGRRPALVLGAEARVHAWAKQAADALAGGAASVSSQELATIADSTSAELGAMFFFDARRRDGTEFRLRPLTGPDALLSLMTHDFLGASSPEGWRRFFATAVAIADRTTLLEATAPLGLENLSGAARRQISNWASYGVATGDTRLPSHA